LQRVSRLSEKYDAEIYFKREDLQDVRSYKIRGSYNKMATLPKEQLSRGVVCASAGNHAQGLAYACNAMQVKGLIYMPAVTPRQKVNKVEMFGKDFVEVVLTGDTFDDAFYQAKRAADEHGYTFVHPFDDPDIIAGQGTVGLEILDDLPNNQEADYVIMAVGGGGLSAGVGSVFQQLSPDTTILGVEPSGAPAMHDSLVANEIVTLDKIDNFVDGAAVKRVGKVNFPIVQATMQEVLLVPEGKVCNTILELYNEEGLVVEPAGALSVAVLDSIADEIKGKTVVCVIGGGNNDILRTEEIRERAMLFSGLKHYFIIEFPQRAGSLREFLVEVLGPDDDITHFEYTKKHNRATGPAMVGIQLKDPQDLTGIINRLEQKKINYEHLNDRPLLFELLI
ncbi:MAG: threonine ammonia-lyase, partial [Bacteroidota bacterium]